MTKNILLMILLTAVLSISNAYSYEYPRITPETAIKTSKAVLVGRVVRVEEVSLESALAWYRMVVLPIQCFYGVDCDKLKNVQISYSNDDMITPGDAIHLSAGFNVGDEYLFIFNREIKDKNVTFDMSWDGRNDNSQSIDMAYKIVADKLLDALTESPFLKTEKVLELRSIYMDYVFKPVKKDFLKMLDERKRQIYNKEKSKEE